jgi:hypothetical protein
MLNIFINYKIVTLLSNYIVSLITIVIHKYLQKIFPDLSAYNPFNHSDTVRLPSVVNTS